MSEKFTLSSKDIGTECWQKLHIYWSEKLAIHRAKVESLRIPDAERLEHAIRIDQIKRFLAVADRQPQGKATDAG